jgi:hypothetical protein
MNGPFSRRPSVVFNDPICDVYILFVALNPGNRKMTPDRWHPEGHCDARGEDMPHQPPHQGHLIFYTA